MFRLTLKYLYAIYEASWSPLQGKFFGASSKIPHSYLHEFSSDTVRAKTAFLPRFDWNLPNLKQAYAIRRCGLKYLLNFYLFSNGPLFLFTLREINRRI